MGLTGGIGSGKSTVSARLADLGAAVIDYDMLARQAVEPGSPALARIAERFGDDVLTADGTLDRPALGRLVFADAAARHALEDITHPVISELAAAAERAAVARVVVHDHPLLVETGTAERCDVVVVVDVAEEIQIERLIRDRGMTEAEASGRIAAQADRTARLRAADVVFDNSGSRADLLAAVDRWWAELAA